MQQLKEAGTMHLRDVIDNAGNQLQALLGLETSNIIAASKTDDGWHVMIELIERKAIPDTQDLLGTYEVVLDDEGYMTSYERVRMRRRMDLEESIA